MKTALDRHSAGVIAVDGPLGPARKIKQGAVRLASDLNYLLVPAGVCTKHKKVVERRWDKMEIPAPFSLIGLSMGEPIEVPPNITKHQIRKLIDQLFDTFEQLENQAGTLIGVVRT